LKVEALDRTTWRACFGRGFGSVVRQTTKWNESDDGCRARFRKVVWGLKPSTIKETKYSRTPLIRTLVIRIGLALRANLSRILQSNVPWNYQLSDQVQCSVIAFRISNQARSKG
jgi:hypothetical protein